MPQLRPFRGLRYDPASVPDMGAVLCPPYDVISALERTALVARDAHNAVALELPDSYEGAASLVDSWQRGGVLRRDDGPLIYIYEQRYTVGQSERVARSFYCRLRLEDYGPGSGVRPHEHTLSGPKEDRFKLLSAARANLSPVLFLYDDAMMGAASGALLDALTSDAPAIAADGPGGVGQRLWAIDPEAVPEAQALLEVAGRKPLTIADGHHRYETALRYRDTPGAAPDAGYVLALLYDAHSGGLSLRPWHRLIAGPLDTADILTRAEGTYAVEPVSDATALLERMRLDDPAAPAGTLGLWMRTGGALLTVAAGRTADLDVDVLSSTLPQMIGATTDELNAAGRLTYVSDARQAIGALDSGEAEVCFLVRPTPVESVLSVASAGGFMPPKSTYFHPKAATGLIFNPLW
ncbi:MAG TPA: DUF1015 domain-containing protein [Candidatus Limnocylindria bacterium]|nr:DUF1015 domain-containing protein [Candidatus Limnocylindria bacterium]